MLKETETVRKEQLSEPIGEQAIIQQGTGKNNLIQVGRDYIRYLQINFEAGNWIPILANIAVLGAIFYGFASATRSAITYAEDIQSADGLCSPRVQKLALAFSREVARNNAALPTEQRQAILSIPEFQGPRGEPGDLGPQGPRGPIGKTGATGLKGETGPQGIQGKKGDTGTQGLKGETGPAGARGLQGEKGDRGTTGARGPQGLRGQVGPQGSQGSKGDRGATGATGTRGATGTTGARGATGPRGQTGSQGARGQTGPQGPRGPRGRDAVQSQSPVILE